MNVASVSAVTITSNEGWLGDPDRGGIHFAVLKGRSGNADVGGPAATFRDAVGLTPERFLRVVRLQAALRTLPGATNWAHVAADLGYHDQAHFIHDVRDLFDATPGELVALQERTR